MAADWKYKHSQPVRLIRRLYDETDDENDRHNEESNYPGSHDFEHSHAYFLSVRVTNYPTRAVPLLSRIAVHQFLPVRLQETVGDFQRKGPILCFSIAAKNLLRFGAVCQNEAHKNWIPRGLQCRQPARGSDGGMAWKHLVLVAGQGGLASMSGQKTLASVVMQ
jgi:hypothetical protein